MAAEVAKPEETQKGDVLVHEEETKKNVEEAHEKDESKPRSVEKSSSYKEESNFLSDLKEFERKALNELRLKLEEAILGNNLYRIEEPKKTGDKAKPEEPKEEEKKEEAKKCDDQEAKPEEPKKTEEKATPEEPKEEEKKEEAKKCDDQEAKPEEPKKTEEKAKPEEPKEEEKKGEAEKCDDEEAKPEEGDNAKVKEGEKDEEAEEKIEKEEVDKEISLWGVPLLPSKGSEGTDVVLLKFLRAREFKVNDAFEMLKKTLQWRKDSKIDSILDEDDLCVDLSSAAYINGVDREGHPVCYNVFGVFENEELYRKTFGTEEKRTHFLRWRCQLTEKSIQKLDLKPTGVSSLLHVNDLKNSPGPSKKELRIATKQAVGLLQDNYPELVAKNIFINVPFWYYALNALLSPFLTQRTKSKFVVARPAKVTETLLKYIPAEKIPVQYGGFMRENDFDFYGDDYAVSELFVKAGTTQTIEIPAPKADTTLVWDLTVLGWEVNYKEEFVPNDEGSYTIIVQKAKKMGLNEGPIRNTFRSNEPGKVVLTIENNSSKKKKVLYRYKTKKQCSSF
ncbi:hypothetical protein L484_025971 [Morus notabilis]|uniref:Patellin-4 n=1 Tax=Morus notabilis TaxID=981085 RepID=W9R7H6_9ROSA|nr:patellin-4 [Morus notabilis]EXB75191.1 hypothetical protein L484_025971 [Morus notabilis]